MKLAGLPPCFRRGRAGFAPPAGGGGNRFLTWGLIISRLYMYCEVMIRESLAADPGFGVQKTLNICRRRCPARRPLRAIAGRSAARLPAVAVRCGRADVALRPLPCRAALCPARCLAGRALRLPPEIVPPADVAARPPMPSARAAAPHGIGKGSGRCTPCLAAGEVAAARDHAARKPRRFPCLKPWSNFLTNRH